MRRLVPGLLLLGAFLLYTQTGAREITWLHQGEDGPELVATALTLGIPHPTGYPLFTLLGRVATMCPGLGPARAMALLSAAAAACALLALFLAARHAARLVGVGGGWSTLGPLAAIVTLAISPTFWSQASIVEVYTLHAALSCGLLLVTLGAAESKDRRRLQLAAFVAGLALGHHLAVTQLLPGLILFLLLERTRVSELARAIPFLLLGASVIAFLPVRAAAEPVLAWGAHERWEGLRWVLSGEQYHFRLHGFDLSRFEDLLGAFAARRIAAELTVASWLLAPLGALLLALRRPSLFLGTFVPFGLSLGMTFAYEIPDPDAYYLPAFILMTLWSAVGLGWLLSAGARLAGAIGAGPPRLGRVLAVGFGVLLLSAAAWPGRERWGRMDASSDRIARDYAEDALDVLPPGALVLTQGDGRTFSLWYACAEAKRSDVAVVYQALLCWPWYLERIESAYPFVRVAGTSMRPDAMADALIAANLPERPVFLTYTDKRRANAYSLAPAGPLFRVEGRRPPARIASTDAQSVSIDISSFANSDYRHDPFRPDPTEGPDHFPHLQPRVLAKDGITLRIRPPFAETEIPSVITTAFQPSFRAEIPLEPRASRGIAMALDGGAIGEASLPVARLVVRYRDGSATEETLVSNRDVWEYWERNHGLTIPDDRLLWEVPEGNESLTFHLTPCDPSRTPQALLIEGTGAMGEEGQFSGIAIFAITQVLDSARSTPSVPSESE